MHASTSRASSQRPSSLRLTLAGSIVVLALLVAAPMVIYPVFLMKLMCYALFAASFNLIIGYVGLLSFGHAAFLGAGAYLCAYAARAWGLDPLICLVIGIAVAAALGAIIGFLAIQRKGIEFSMITLALAQVVEFIAQQAPFTGGEDGIHGVPRGHLFGFIDLNNSVAIYAFILILFAFGMAALWRTVNSPFGHVLQAIRDHEDRAVSIGYGVRRYKLTAFVISAALGGLAGGMQALIFQLATLDDVSFHLSGAVILMALLGGVGTFFGPFIGAAIVVALESVLATSEFPAPIITGAVFILCVLVFRRGIAGEIALRLADRKARRHDLDNGAAPGRPQEIKAVDG